MDITEYSLPSYYHTDREYFAKGHHGLFKLHRKFYIIRQKNSYSFWQYENGTVLLILT